MNCHGFSLTGSNTPGVDTPSINRRVWQTIGYVMACECDWTGIVTRWPHATLGGQERACDRWHAPQFLVQRGWEFSLKTDHVVNNELFDLAFPLLSSQPALNSFGVR